MYRWFILALLVGCEATADVGAPPPSRGLGAAPTSWPLGVAAGHLGREVAPQPVASLDLTGEDAPLRTPMPWQVPGEGPARAVVSGVAGDRYAAELVDIDHRRVVWRDTKTCGAPVVGVTASSIVCADANGTRALKLDGTVAWTQSAPFLALGGNRVVTDAGGGAVAVRDAETGGELATVALPKGVAPDAVVAVCDRDVYAATHEGVLVRIAGKALWTAPVGSAASVDACAGSTVLVVVAGAAGPALLALARDTGKIVGRVDGVRGLWPARGRADRIEVATARGVARMPRDLSASEVLALPPLGALLATRGDRRLVRATPQTAVLLDARGVRAFVPVAELGAALGDEAILAGSWLGSPAQTARLVAIPRPWRRPLRLPPDPAGLAIAAELRDLPAPTPLDAAAAVALPDTAAQGVAASALDPIEPALYAVARDGGAAGIARFDLASRAWTWHRADACPPGADLVLAASRAIVVCGTHAGVRATARDGAAAWQREGNADALDAAADIVAVHDAARLRVLDARDGHLLGTIATAHAAAVDIAGMAIVVSAEANRIVARLPRAWMLPAWSIEVRGVVRELAASGDGVLVALEDGDAYRIDARTAHVVALPGVGLAWRAAGDVVTGETAGGPIPPVPMPAPPKVLEKYKPVDLEAAAAIATPWPPPPPMAPSWQYTLFELGGGVRARNDYALQPPVVPSRARGGGASPLLIEHGAGPRRVLVIDPVHGDPLRRIELPPDAPADVAFSTIVDGRPVAGTILAAPLRVVLF